MRSEELTRPQIEERAFSTVQEQRRGMQAVENLRIYGALGDIFLSQGLSEDMLMMFRSRM